MSVRNFNDERCFVMKLDIINDLRKLPAEFFGQEYDSDLFVCDGALQSFLQLVVLMNDHTLYTGRRPDFITSYVNEAIGLKL